jgi:hypothetical protein
VKAPNIDRGNSDLRVAADPSRYLVDQWRIPAMAVENHQPLQAVIEEVVEHVAQHEAKGLRGELDTAWDRAEIISIAERQCGRRDRSGAFRDAGSECVGQHVVAHRAVGPCSSWEPSATSMTGPSAIRSANSRKVIWLRRCFCIMCPRKAQ